MQIAEKRERKERAKTAEIMRLTMWGDAKDFNKRINKDWDDE